MSDNLKEILPKYRCHKEVWAAKIIAIDDFNGKREDGASALIFESTEEDCDGGVICSREWIDKHKPEAGGYFVVYDDNYKSYSPAKAFEEGYSIIKADRLSPEEQERMQQKIGIGSFEDEYGSVNIQLGRRTVSSLMQYCPATGREKPYPSEAGQYRDYHGKVAWLFNPYTGEKRSADDIGYDTFGHNIMDAGKPHSPLINSLATTD